MIGGQTKIEPWQAEGNTHLCAPEQDVQETAPLGILVAGQHRPLHRVALQRNESGAGGERRRGATRLSKWALQKRKKKLRIFVSR